MVSSASVIESNMNPTYSFTSNLFSVLPGEDDETNPACYGKELGNWLCVKFKELGYEVEELIPEDWGWCVMCRRDSYLLWVGCGSLLTETAAENFDPAVTPKPSDIIWRAFAEVEIPFFYFKSHFLSMLGKLDTKTAYEKLDRELKQILEQEPGIHFCEEP
ncbi:hypothetical protein [Undibacterium pigrum]|uniref:Uncharacterized protein n=1 Tax=Undibacterium pigrum TaxID=401470 RepID=A0A318J1H9_9BURK|nr:hypothetical protein [Undibacterium pigrum]PXX41455.1 hypothetical protein DFR42_107106 [Undibacterium pigrum]